MIFEVYHLLISAMLALIR